MDEVDSAERAYEGETYQLPNELIALQVETLRSDAACRAAVEADDGTALAITRVEPLQLITGAVPTRRILVGGVPRR